MQREPLISTPPVITALAIITIAIYLMQAFLPSSVVLPLEATLAFQPLRFTTGLETGGDPFALAVPLFGHMFLHGGTTHILFNALWMVVFGTGVARRMAVDYGPTDARLIRSSLFLTFYLLCGLGGVMSYHLLQPESPTLLVGASGAISGLLGAAIRFILPARGGGRFGSSLASVLSPQVLVVSGAFIALNLATALGIDAMNAGDASIIAWEAHIGGYLTGLFVYPLFDRLSRGRNLSVDD